MQQPTTQTRPVSGRQREFFRYQLEEALRLPERRRQAFLCAKGWTLDYLYQMAEVEPVQVEPVNEVTLTPEEAQAKLVDLQARAHQRESPWLQYRRQQVKQQASKA
jgi:hypothetical protein